MADSETAAVVVSVEAAPPTAVEGKSKEKREHKARRSKDKKTKASSESGSGGSAECETPSEPSSTPSPAPAVAVSPPAEEKPTRTKEEEEEHQRQSVLREIISTEEGYVSDLNVMVNVRARGNLFYLLFFILICLTALTDQKPTKVIVKKFKEKSIVPEATITNLFSCVAALQGFNEVLLQKLKGGEGVGSSFAALAQFLKMYGVYAINEPKAEELVDQLMKKTSFKNFLAELHAEPELHGHKLRDFLMKPVQRLCRYPLLLRELLKHTPPDHPDFKTLTEALQKIEAAVASVNEGKRTDESYSKVVAIAHRLEGLDSHTQMITPTRRYIREAMLHELLPSGTFLDTLYILFTDLLLRVKPTAITGKLVLKSFMPKEMLLVSKVDNADQTRVLPSAPSGKRWWLFDVMHVGVDKFTVATESEEERTSWVEGIDNIVQKTLEDSYRRFAGDSAASAASSAAPTTSSSSPRLLDPRDHAPVPASRSPSGVDYRDSHRGDRAKALPPSPLAPTKPTRPPSLFGLAPKVKPLPLVPKVCLPSLSLSAKIQ